MKRICLNYKFFISAFFILLFPDCRSLQKNKPLFTLTENTGIWFVNTVQNLPGFNIFSYRNFYNGGGVGIGDINNDGLADVFFTANMGSNKLFLNKGNWQFEDISQKAGFTDKKDWSTGVVMADVNSDGWLDIYVCNAGFLDGKKPKSQLYINNKNLTFTEKAEEYGLTNEGGYTTHAAFFDYDLDGDLDCFIINNSFIPVNTLNYANKRNLRAPDWPVADFLKGGGDHLYRNDNGKFTDVSKEAGIYGSLISFGLGVTVGDVNGDHYPDIYVSNDFFERDYLYINQRNGTFKDEIENWVQHISHSSMGADMADINNDGYPDIYTTDMLPPDDYRLKTTTSFDNIDVYRLKYKTGFYHQFTQNTLQVNNRNNKFTETAFYSGVAATDWSWGGLIFDADNDGLNDIFVCNGIYHDVTDQDFIEFFANDIIQKMVLTGQKEKFDEIVKKMPSRPVPNHFFKNHGNLMFKDETQSAGLEKPSFSNGSAFGDLDNDGDLDLVINNVNMPCFVYRNNAQQLHKNNYIAIQLKGKDKNTFAVGAKVYLYQENQILYRELIPTRGFQSSIDYKIIIGLGSKQADSLRIIWPDKTQTFVIAPALNRILTFSQTEAKAFSEPQNSSSELLFQPAETVFHKHMEDDYIDFYTERNIPVMLSREGPRADTADVNGDGLTDFYIGGAAGQPGVLYLKQKKGFRPFPQALFEEHRMYEDIAIHFFDADNDGDKDLFIGSGGNVHPPGSPLLQHRLYLNDGKGYFSLPAKNAFPPYRFNCSKALAFDADDDGDQDLFVAARSIPQFYGAWPMNYLYENDGSGKFTVADSVKAGLVTDACLADVNNDGKKELVVVGEWTYPRVFTVSQKRLIEQKTGLEDYKGWWQCIYPTDADNDGDTDLLIGNLGQNFYLKPDKQHPVRLCIQDFDKNGTKEKLLTRTLPDKREVPVFLKKELTDQMPSLKKTALKYEAYARKTVKDLFSPSLLKQAEVHEWNYSLSVVAMNGGKGNFSILPLPYMAQLSSVNAFAAEDLNGDGRKDLIVCGNKFHFQPMFSRIDANYGLVLTNKGVQQDSLEWHQIEPAKSGLEVRGEVKQIMMLPYAEGRYLLILQNDEKALLFKLRS
ncbi:MAG: VCBS repeat-containing protein [Chitinophagaceae bacterium]|nr:VCBS repeat-containing protein [Chitinophagaceae bacterium]